MSVMSAAMSYAVMNAGVRRTGSLSDRQRIHIGAQPDRPVRVAGGDDTHDTGPADAFVNFDAPLT